MKVANLPTCIAPSMTRITNHEPGFAVLAKPVTKRQLAQLGSAGVVLAVA
jgi:hypothetical protein